MLWAGLRPAGSNGARRGLASGGTHRGGVAPRSAVPPRPRLSGEAPALAAAAAVPPQHRGPPAPGRFVQVNLKQVYDILLLISILELLWLLHVTDESPEIRSPEKSRSSLK